MTRPEPAHTSIDLAEAFAALNDHLRAAAGPAEALARLVQLAVDALPGCDWAAVTAWPRGGHPYSLVTSGAVATAADRLQYRCEEGPCLAAAAGVPFVRVGDVTTDDRWPSFVDAVARTSVRGVLCFHVAERPHRSALNLYSARAGGFEDRDLTLAALFAAHARVLLHLASAEDVTNLEHALLTSRQIGAAVGILMNIHKLTKEDAFELLRTTSQQLNRKLRDIADEVTETGLLPG